MTPSEHTKLSKLLAMLASDQDGEALAATRMVVRLLAKHGKRPEDLKLGIATPQYANARPAQPPPPPSKNPRPQPHYTGNAAIAVQLLEKLRGHISDWEIGFLSSLTKMHAYRKLSEKQERVLNKLKRRAGME